MRPPALLRTLPWLLAAALAVAGAWLLARAELLAQREAFDTDARIAHRLMSQRVVQHDAVLATLALLQPEPGTERPEQRLPSVYPQILRAGRRDPGQAWDRDALREAESRARTERRAVLVPVDPGAGRYELVTAAGSAAYVLLIDLRQTVPWDEWPMAPERSPVRVTLELPGLPAFVVQPGQAGGAGWALGFEKVLASASQPFNLVARRTVRWTELPWTAMAGWVLLVALALLGWRAWQRQLAARRRAEELLRLGQVARLNTLGELAAGLAHELNQPLTAVLANTQAAARLLQDDPAELPLARQAMNQAAEQARRAADVVGRLRRVVERPSAEGDLQALPLSQAVRSALHLLEPEFKRHQVAPELLVNSDAPVRADPVALEQIVHNLLMNALQALDQVPAAERQLTVALDPGRLSVADSGPGIAPEVLPRLFQPFFSTRAGGLGLGLSLCETLAANMGGALSGHNREPRGAEFTLTLPLA